MNGSLFAHKGKQQQAFNKETRVVVTQLHVAPSYVVGFRTFEKNGYWAFIIAYGRARTMERINKPMRGLLTSVGITTPLSHVAELRIPLPKNPQVQTTDGKQTLTIADKTYAIGMELKAPEVFAPGEIVRVVGTSKGKGFQGVVKRHGFAGGPKTHGQSDRHRAPGSIGQRTIPGRVYRGKKMAGRMGSLRITVKGLAVESVTDSMITVRGLVPGGPHSLVQIVK